MHKPYCSVIGPLLIPQTHEIFIRVERPDFVMYRERPTVLGSADAVLARGSWRFMGNLKSAGP